MKRAYVMTRRSEKMDEDRSRIKASAMQLYRERPVEEFTIDEVAQRAEVSVRTVLRAYGSKEELVLAALYELAAIDDYPRSLPVGDLAAAVTAKFDIYESLGDLVLRLLADEGRRPALKPMLDEGRVNHRRDIQIEFAPQLEKLRGAARKELLTMLVVLTDIYVWKLLRREMGYGRAASEAIVRKMIRGIIEEGD